MEYCCHELTDLCHEPTIIFENPINLLHSLLKGGLNTNKEEIRTLIRCSPLELFRTISSE